MGLHQSLVPVKASVYGRLAFASSGMTERPTPLAVSDANFRFGVGVFDRTPMEILQGEGLNLSNLLDTAPVLPREDDFTAVNTHDSLTKEALWTLSPSGKRPTGTSHYGLDIPLEGLLEYANESMSGGGWP